MDLRRQVQRNNRLK